MKTLDDTYDTRCSLMTSLCVMTLKKKKHVTAPDEFMMDKFEQIETE